MTVRKFVQRKIARSGYGHCADCGQRCLLVLHHIRGRKIPGWNKRWNEAWICSCCHFSQHSNHPDRIVITGWEQTTDGLKLAWHRAGEVQEGIGYVKVGLPLSGKVDGL